MTAPTTTILLRPAGREGEAGRRVVEAYERLLQSRGRSWYTAQRGLWQGLSRDGLWPPVSWALDLAPCLRQAGAVWRLQPLRLDPFEVHGAGVPKQRLPLPCLDMAGEQQRVRPAGEDSREAAAALKQR